MKGKITHICPLYATLEQGQIGYRILIPVSAYTALSTTREEVLLYVSEVIREDSHRLFGFLKRGERDRFEVLCDISGIGPKTALLLIGHLPQDELHLAITHGDAKTIARVPGIGKKTAERLILELRDKVGKKDLPPNTPLSDALSALVNLGYQEKQAHQALKKVLETSAPAELGALITAALRII